MIEKLKLTEGSYLKCAAVLLFHPDPQTFVTGVFVKIGFFRSESELVYHDEVVGDLFTQGRQTIDLLHTKYLKAAVGYEGMPRIERFPVPRTALREAVMNALVHRDYAVPAPVQIRVYEDRLKLWNPAVLPEGWSLEKLVGEHPSLPFNPLLANAFFRAGEIEAWGRGIHRIYQACQEAGSLDSTSAFEAGMPSEKCLLGKRSCDGADCWGQPLLVRKALGRACRKERRSRAAPFDRDEVLIHFLCLMGQFRAS